MDKLEDVTLQQLQDLLGGVQGKKPTMRVLAAINYKQGVLPKDMAEWYNVSVPTIYNWINRFEERPLREAPYDKERSGAPSKLDAAEKEQLRDVLHKPPTEVGYEAPAWTPKLVQSYIAREFEVEYSLRHVRRLMHGAGLSWRKARPKQHEADEGERARFREEFAKKTRIECRWVYACRYRSEETHYWHAAPLRVAP